MTSHLLKRDDVIFMSPPRCICDNWIHHANTSQRHTEQTDVTLYLNTHDLTPTLNMTHLLITHFKYIVCTETRIQSVLLYNNEIIIDLNTTFMLILIKIIVFKIKSKWEHNLYIYSITVVGIWSSHQGNSSCCHTYCIQAVSNTMKQITSRCLAKPNLSSVIFVSSFFHMKRKNPTSIYTCTVIVRFVPTHQHESTPILSYELNF